MNKKMMRTCLLFLLMILSHVNLSSSQFNLPRNIETFYPLPFPPPPRPPVVPPAPAQSPDFVPNPAPAEPPEFAPKPAPAESPELAPSPASAESPEFVPNAAPAEPPEFLPIITPPSPPSLSSKKAIVTAVSATAVSAFVIAAVFFLLLTRFSRKRRRDETGAGRDGRPPPVVASETRSELKRFDSGDGKGYVDEDGLDMMYWKKLKSNSSQPATVPRTRSSTSHGQLRHEETAVNQRSSFSSPPPMEIPSETEVAPPPAPLPPPPPIPVTNSQMPPPPPPSKSAVPPPKPPPPGGKVQKSEAVGSGSDHVKLKPLHWEKVNITRDHSNVWDKVERGSFQYNGDMMEALFGVAANKRNPSKEENSADNGGESSISNARIFILDQRKSQNVAIVIKSLGVPRDDLIEGLLEGKGLSAESLEKLTRIAPTKDEASEILAFNGDLSKLADAEFFLYSLLKAVPTTFTRANEMLFRFNYDSEIHNLKDSLQTMELACSELKSRGIFLKLLEAILKAGNRLNAGTSRGNAKSFNLTTLRKLSDYKSSDGKSTLLHFVVHEVVRNEGKRCVLMRSRSIGRQSGGSGSSPQPENLSAKEELEKEYLRLGLPVVGGLSSEFSDVKKSANIDYDAFKSSLGSLASRVGEATELVANSSSIDEGGGFLKEMKNFLVSAEMEIKEVQEEHSRVMEEVKRTTHYYQARSSNDRSPLQLFAIVKDFLSMVDLACVEIARTVQQKRQPKPESGSGSGSTNSDALHKNFAGLPKNFMSDKSSSSSSDDDR